MFSNWTRAVPVYVTRETADRMVMTYSLAAWMPLLILFLAALNAICWGVIGLVEVVKYAL